MSITERDFKLIVEAVRYGIAEDIRRQCQDAAADAMIKVFTRNDAVVNMVRDVLREEAQVIINAKLQNVKAVIQCER